MATTIAKLIIVDIAPTAVTVLEALGIAVGILEGEADFEAQSSGNPHRIFVSSQFYRLRIDD